MTKPDLSDNPYFQLPQGFDPSRYYGSQVWTDLTLQNASADPPRSIELIGLPGMGKSTLMRYLAHDQGALEKNRAALTPPFDSDPWLMFMVLAEFRLLPTDQHPFVYLHDQFFEAYKEYTERNQKEITDPPKLSRSPEPLTADSATDAIATALTKLKQFGIRVVFLLDDFHLAFAKLDFSQTTRIRPWRDRAAFVISTERRLVKVNPRAAGSPFFQILPIVPFGGLTPDEARHLLRDPANRADWPFAPDDIEFTLAQAGTHPHLLIVAGAVLWELRKKLLTKGKKTAISKEYQQLLIGHFKERFVSTFQMYIEHLETSERRALSAIVNEEDPKPHYQALAYLERLGLVQLVPDHGVGFRPFSAAFGEYIKGTETSRPSQQEIVVLGIEGNLLEYLRSHPDNVHSFDELAENVWGETAKEGKERELLERRVQVAISRLRKKLQESGAGDVINVRGKGYKLVMGQS